jgi:hypothetical protein
MNLIKRALILLVLFVVIIPSTALAQTATSVQINYVEVMEGDTALNLNVYFTVIAETGLPLTNPRFDRAEFIQLDNNYRTSGPVNHAETPFYIAMVLDASGSMARSGEELRAAATSAIGSAPSTAQIAVYRFNNQIDLLQDFTNNGDRLRNAIATVEPVQNAGTCLYDAAYQAIEHLASAPSGRRALILFTDGRDEVASGAPCSTHVYDEVVALALDPNYNVPIHTIGLSASSSNINTVELENMASTTRGFSRISSSGNLTNDFDVIMDALNSQFVATAQLFPTRGPHDVALQFFLADSITLPATTSFVSSRDYMLPASGTLDNVEFDLAADMYRLHMYFTSPQLIDHLEVAVWDARGGVQVAEYVYRDLTTEQTFEIPTDGMDADKEYEFRIAALSADETAVVDTSGIPISFTSEVRYEPTIVETELSIPSVSIQDQSLLVNIQLVDAGLVTAYEGWLVNQETNVKVPNTDFRSLPGTPSVTIPLAELAEGRYTIVLRALDANNQLVTEVYYEGVEYVPPTPPSRISVLLGQISEGLKRNWWVLVVIIVVIVGGIGALVLIPLLERRRTGTPVLQGKLESNLSGKASPLNLTRVLERPPEASKPRPAQPRPAREQPSSPRPSAERPSAPRPAPAQPAQPRPSAERPSAPRPAAPAPVQPRPVAFVPQPAAQPSTSAVLKVAFSPDPSRHGQIISIGPDTVTIGRENCEILFAADPKVSRRHAMLAFNPAIGAFTITDLGSANGVSVNGARLAPNVPATLTHGAIILLGPSTRLIFERGGK